MDGKTVDGSKIADLLAKTRSAMLLADDSRIYVDVNQAACEMLGMDRKEVIGMKVEELSSPELREAAPEMFEAFLRQGSQAGPYTLVRKDGSTVSCCYSASANVVPGVHLSILVPTELADAELDSTLEETTAGDNAPHLTDREREVLTLLALGETNQTIAEKLHLSPETIRAHTRSARLRLGAKSRSHAIALALQSGQLQFDGA